MTPAHVIWQRHRVAPGNGPDAWEWRAVPVEQGRRKRARR